MSLSIRNCKAAIESLNRYVDDLHECINDGHCSKGDIPEILETIEELENDIAAFEKCISQMEG